MAQMYSALRIYLSTWYILSEIKMLTREPFARIVDRLVVAEIARIKAAQQQEGKE